MDSFLFKIEKDNIDELNNIKINEYHPIQDGNDNKILINKLTINGNKILIETNYLKVEDVLLDKNKVIINLSENYINLFNKIDEICQKLLEDLLNSDDELETWDINWDSQKIQYNSLLNEDSMLKLNINSKTTIKLNSSDNCNIENINAGDYVALVIGLDYISLLVDTMEARTKLYCYFIQLHKQNVYIKEERETIDNWTFSNKLNPENIFIKTNISHEDNIDVKTEFINNLNISDNNLDNNEIVLEEVEVKEVIIENKKKPQTRRNKKIEIITDKPEKKLQTRRKLKKAE